MKKIIHINKHKIASNRIHGKREPVVTCKTYKSNDYGHEVVFHGPGKVVYSPDKPLKCGAWVWIETEAPVTVIERKRMHDLLTKPGEEHEVEVRTEIA